MDENSKPVTQEDFLASLMQGADGPVTSDTLQEMMRDLEKQRKETQKDRLRHIHSEVQEHVLTLRKLRAREEKYKQAISNLKQLAVDVLNGKLDGSEDFVVKAVAAANVTGPKFCC